MWNNILAIIQQKQHQAIQQFVNQFEKLNKQQSNTVQVSLQNNQDQLKQNTNKNKQSLNNIYDNIEQREFNEQKQIVSKQNYIQKSQQKINSQKNINTVNGQLPKSDLQRDMNNKNQQQNQFQDLPNPKINKISQSPIIISQNQYSNQFQHKSTKQYVQQLSYQKQSEQSQLNKLSIFTLRDQNPDQISQLKTLHPSQTHSKPDSQYNFSSSPQIKIKQGIKNARLRKNSKNMNRNKAYLKTQTNSQYQKQFQQIEKDKDQYSGISMYVARQKQQINQRVKMTKNISIISNVVSYCQSLNSSNIIEDQNLYNQQERNIGSQTQLKQLKKNIHINKKKKVAQRYKTEQSHVINKSQIKKIKNVDQFYQNQVQTKLQLRMVFEKKKNLQQKLKKLDQQLNRLNKQQQAKLQANIQRDGRNPQNTIKINQMFKNKNYRNQSVSLSGYMSEKNKKYQSQLENSKKAVAFVKRVSKQSLQRRLNNKKKIASDIIQRAKNHVCMDCSRVKCKAQAIQGQVRFETKI